MKHSIVTRINFTDLSLMGEYLKITKEVLIPSLKSQTVKAFEWIVLTNVETLDILKSELDYPFTPLFSNPECHSYLIKNSINIQTRHDCDDYMSPNYVEEIQRLYLQNRKRHKTFLIQAQPTQLLYQTGEEIKLKPYSNQRCSMFLSLCQEKVENHIFERKHGQMYEITSNVITMPVGYAKWVIHGKNRSVLEKKK